MAPRGVSVGNLTTDWNDGTALCALVDYNVNGIYDLYQGKQPIRNRYFGHVIGYQPIRDQYSLSWNDNPLHSI